MARKVVAEELSRDRIVSSAKELFGTCGYRALTMRSIAKSLGYSHGALYYHFKEKSELLYELIVSDFDNLYNELRLIMMEAIYINCALLKKMMMMFIKFGLEYPRHYEMIFMMDEEELRVYSNREQARCFELFSLVIKQLFGSKGNTDERQSNLVWTLFMSMHGFISYNIYYGYKFADIENSVQDHINFLSEMMEKKYMEQASTSLIRNHVIA